MTLLPLLPGSERDKTLLKICNLVRFKIFKYLGWDRSKIILGLHFADKRTT